jgi:hypothetical protein
MILLTDTSQYLAVTTSSASDIDWTANWVDLTASATTPDSDGGDITSATDTTIVASPAASTQRVLKLITLFNRGSTSNTVTLKHYANAKLRYLRTWTLQAGESACYEDTGGFRYYDASGQEKRDLVVAAPIPAIVLPVNFASANLTTAKTITSTNSFAIYMGKAPRSLTSVQVRLRVTTAAVTIVWAEIGIAKGTPTVAANPSLTVVGYADVSAVVNSTGQKTVTVNVNAAQSLSQGEDIWVVIGNQATTALAVRALSIADDLQAGFQASVVGRPSLLLGVGQTFTLEGATTAGPWVALAY